MEGYAKVASRMATLPELAIFRRFQALNAQRLLYAQAELTHLEERLRAQAEADAGDGNDRSKLFSHDWYSLSTPDAEGQVSEQWRLMGLISSKLDRYNKALYDQAQLSRLVAPLPARDLAILNSLLDNPALPDYLLGLDSKTWNDPTLASDLCSVAPVHAYTPLTTLLIRLFLGPYNRPIGRRRRARNGEAGAINADADLWYYRDSRLEFPAHVASTVLASVLPMAAIAVLYVVPGMTQRLGIVAAFMAMFSLTLTLLTQAKGVEIAAATAAFAAVQVVFISTNGPGSMPQANVPG